MFDIACTPRMQTCLYEIGRMIIACQGSYGIFHYKAFA